MLLMFGKRKSSDETGNQGAPDDLTENAERPATRTTPKSDDKPTSGTTATPAQPAPATPPPSRIGMITAPSVRSGSRLGITAPPTGPAAAVQALTRAGTAPADLVNEGRSLVVGREICLSGEIKSCDRLVIEGKVELSRAESRTLEVSEEGIYRGDAVVENCVIAGLFEGNLSARGRVTLKSTGRITGTLRYGELEIERGGKATGALEEAGAEPASGTAAETDPPAAPTEDLSAGTQTSTAQETSDDTRRDEQVKTADAG
jgi:cytoskeletal protein CcmA (bactofilin family)